MKKLSVFMAGAVLILSQALTPVAAGWNPDKKKPTTTEEVQETIANFLDQDSGLQKFFDNAHGYAVFPKIYKAAIGVGGAYGSGQVYERGKFIGDSTLNQLTIGLQLGG
jgi:lipid-binding SYLF domain-containing protein